MDLISRLYTFVINFLVLALGVWILVNPEFSAPADPLKNATPKVDLLLAVAIYAFGAVATFMGAFLVGSPLLKRAEGFDMKVRPYFYSMGAAMFWAAIAFFAIAVACFLWTLFFGMSDLRDAAIQVSLFSFGLAIACAILNFRFRVFMQACEASAPS